MCGEEGTGECVTSLHPANVDCHGNFCTFPLKSNWMEADFAHADSEQCASETTLQYWHVCYDCMMHVAAMEAQVYVVYEAMFIVSVNNFHVINHP